MSTNKSILGIFSKTKHEPAEEEVLTHAHKKAQRIIEQAVEKAEQIMAQTDVFTSDLKSDVKKSWKEHLDKTAIDLQKESLELMKKVMQDFREELVSDMKHSQALLQQKISEEFNRIEESLKEYEKNQKQEIDAAVEEKVRHIVKTSLSSAISAKDHESLVIAALQEAKKDGIIS